MAILRFQKLYDEETYEGIAAIDPCGTNIPAIIGTSPYVWSANFDDTNPRHPGWSSMRCENRSGYNNEPCRDGDLRHRIEPIYYIVEGFQSDLNINWWYGVSYRLDLNWPTSGYNNFCMIMQYKKKTATLPSSLAELALYASVNSPGEGIEGSEVSIDIHSTAYDADSQTWLNDRKLPGTISLPRGQWADLVIRHYRARDSSGELEIWKKVGSSPYQLIYSYEGPTAYWKPTDFPDGGPEDFRHKCGIYWGDNEYGDSIFIQNHCAIRIATSELGDNSGFALVDPSQYGGGLLIAEANGPYSADVDEIIEFSSAGSIDNYYPPTDAGRVEISGNTLVTSNGEKLRGVNALLSNTIYLNNSWWENLRDNYNLNTVRMDVTITTPIDSCSTLDAGNLDIIFSNLDDAIEIAEFMGMYIIINNKSCCCGNYNQDLAELFWSEAAVRYKDNTNVIYEIQNQPTTAGVYYSADIQFENDMYSYIRALAPDTHIICWSSSRISESTKDYIDSAIDINYVNASVGLQPYYHELEDSNFSNLAIIKSAYPVIITEFSPSSFLNTEEIWDYCETNGISWVYLDLENGVNSGNGVVDSEEWLTQYWM